MVGNGSDSPPWCGGTRGLALISAAIGAGMLASVALLVGLGVVPVSAQQAACDQIPPVAVHYQTVAGHYPGVTSAIAVSGVVLSGFPGACDGHTVTLRMWGNSAGDPSLPVSSDRLLSTANSSLQPCTQRTLSRPVVVTNGSIALALCAAGGPGGYVSVHDLTALALLVSAEGTQGQVKAQSTTAPSSGPPSPGLVPPPRHQGTLGATTPSSGAHLLLALAEFLVVMGAALLALGVWMWRRQRATRPS